MRWYDGAYRPEQARQQMQRDGYVCAFVDTYGDGYEHVPQVVKDAPDRDGWAKRRAIKAWAKARGLTDVIPFRATDYLPDLHGKFVYEAWVKIDEWNAARDAGKGGAA